MWAASLFETWSFLWWEAYRVLTKRIPAPTTSSLPAHTDTYMDGEQRIVRFDEDCILIPEFSPRKHPHILSVPLWRRRPSHTTFSDSDTPDAEHIHSSPEETHVVIKVPIPSFIRRPSISPTRRLSPSSSPTIPLSPCLVHRSPSQPSHGRARRPSLPMYHPSKEHQTIPLRACCPNCIAITEESLREGELWQERFTRGARRRRSASLDNAPRTRTFPVPTPGSPPLPTASSSHTIPLQDKKPIISITVDEVDKRRKSQEKDRIGHQNDAAIKEKVNHPHKPFNTHDRESSNESSSSSFVSFSDLISVPESIPMHQSSPIAEVDEDDLFPLPSPRRSPSSSIVSSPSASPRPSPIPSPNPSSACLHPSSALSINRSRDSFIIGSFSDLGLGQSSNKEILPNTTGIARGKGKETGKNILTPGNEKTADLAIDPTPSGSSTPRGRKPLLQPLTLFNQSSNEGDKVSRSPTSPLFGAISTSFGSDVSTVTATSIPSPITPNSPLFSNRKFEKDVGIKSPKSPPLREQSKTRTDGVGGHSKRKMSFTTPFLKATEAIRGAGVEVLKGVSSMGGTGGGMLGKI